MKGGVFMPKVVNTEYKKKHIIGTRLNDFQLKKLDLLCKLYKKSRNEMLRQLIEEKGNK